MNKTEARTKLKLLIDEFEDNKRYIKEHYTEEDTKQKLIQPFFEILGWDFRRNEEVRYERSGGKGGRVDYVFGKNHFYLEAKAASINLNDDAASNYILQANLYAYNKSKFCLLTDFEDFKLIKPIRPNKIKPKIAVVDEFNFKYDKYLENFNLLYDTFSKEVVLNNNSLEKLLEKEKKRRKFLTIDEDFLGDLDNWRKDLALDIYKNNKKLIGDNSELLTEYTQRLLDRIIFVKILEDRGIEHNLLEKFISGENIYPKILKVFKEIGGAYNGLIFNPHPVDEINISDTSFKKILENIYDTPKNYNVYRFNEIPIEILGSIYERFLGKIIQVNPENAKGIVKVIEKPEFRKAEGVYYTPNYIVEYIVKNTVGKLFKKKTPREVENIKIIDIACGSGSFLVEAYTYLLNWYQDFYVNNPSKAKSDNSLYKDKLTREKRKEILKKHIYGVDIDPQAVEVTQMSLFAKMLEDCPDIQQEFKLSEFILPDMKDNIKCGNSLIENDIADITDEERQKIKPFNWEDKFPEIIQYETTFQGEKILKEGYGFDCVIGNPPWVSLTGKFGNDILSEAAQRYLINKYRGNTYMPNLYEYFVHEGLILLKENGLFSFIVPDRLGYNSQFVSLRKNILENYIVEELLYKAEFPNIVTDTLIFRFSKRKDKSYKIFVGEFGKNNQMKNVENYLRDEEYKFSYEQNDIVGKFLEKLFKNIKNKPLGELVETTSGFGGKSAEITKGKISNKQIKIFRGRSVQRYAVVENFYFEFKKSNITGRTTDINKLGAKEKVLLRKTGIPIAATYDNSGTFPEQSLYFLFNNKTNISLKYFTALINSKLFQFVYLNKLVTNRDSTPQLKKVDLDKFPIHTINFSSQAEKSKHDKIVELVDKIINLNKKNSGLSLTSYQKEDIQDKINKIDDEINNLVYKLYGFDSETKEGREAIEMIERELEK